MKTNTNNINQQTIYLLSRRIKKNAVNPDLSKDYEDFLRILGSLESNDAARLCEILLTH